VHCTCPLSGLKQTWPFAKFRFRGRYSGQSGHAVLRRTCLLLTQSGRRYRYSNKYASIVVWTRLQSARGAPMNKLIFPFVFGLLPFIAPVAAAEDDLSGTYKLISSTRKILETGEVKNSYGEHPSGYIMYGKDGRFLVLITLIFFAPYFRTAGPTNSTAKAFSTKLISLGLRFGPARL